MYARVGVAGCVGVWVRVCGVGVGGVCTGVGGCGSKKG